MEGYAADRDDATCKLGKEEMRRGLDEAIVYWHRRYYSPLTIASLVGIGVSVADVLKVIYAYEESLRRGR